MDDLIASEEEDYSESTKRSFKRYSDAFEKWRGDNAYSEELVSKYVHCYFKGSENCDDKYGTFAVPSHRASSTRTMFSHLRKYLQDHVHFVISDSCLSVIYRYIGNKEKKQPTRHAKIFKVEEVANLFKIHPETMTQTRDLLIFAIGVCTLARSAELCSMKVEDIEIKADGFFIVLHRKKACADRAIQQIWVSGIFFGWNLLNNLKSYLACIPESGPLWRRIPPSPKNVLDCAPLARTTIDSTPTKMATKLKLENPMAYHSHSLRRTGATLLAMAGRTEEQIKTMGNWTSASAVIRYIENSEVSMRKNASAIALPGFIAPEFTELTPPGSVPVDTIAASPVPINPKTIVVPVDSTVPKVDDVTCEKPVPFQIPNPECDDICPPAKKKHSGVVFTGNINQVIVVNSQGT